MANGDGNMSLQSTPLEKCVLAVNIWNKNDGKLMGYKICQVKLTDVLMHT